jgi:hypothetical protein
MDLPVEGRDIYFHVRILIGVVLGLGLTRILSGVAAIVQHPGHKKLYAPHLLWVAVVVVAMIHFWWFEYGLVRISPWRFQLFVFVLFYAFTFFLLANVLMPLEMSEYPNYEAYFTSRRRWFFGLLAATVPIDFIDTVAKGWPYFRNLGPEYPFRLGLLLAVCAIGAWTSNRRVQVAIAAIYLAYYVSWILRVYDVIG